MRSIIIAAGGGGDKADAPVVDLVVGIVFSCLSKRK
jgi:hypothetical protein